MKNYREFFKQVTGRPAPLPWQERFANWDGKLIAAVSAFDEAGKAIGAIAPWLHLQAINRPSTTRLVYVLPNRALVKQVAEKFEQIVEASGLSIPIYSIEKAEDRGYERNLTQSAILVGTNAQLISRALNRGFGISWEQRPLHYAALTNDCTWILDEIQLMGTASKTLIQYYQYWQELGHYGSVRLCLMSSFFDDRWLQDINVEKFELSDADLKNSLLKVKISRSIPLAKLEVASVKDVARQIRAKHVVGNLSLVIINETSRAQEIGKLLADLDPLIIHDRFLGIDIEEKQRQLKNYLGIVITTEVIAAKIEVNLLITELCPWHLFVQRCKCDYRFKEGKPLEIYWLHYLQDGTSAPYSDKECEETSLLLQEVTDASIANLCKIKTREPKLPGLLLSKRNIETLFCTHEKNRDIQKAIFQYASGSSIKSTDVLVAWSAKLPEQLPARPCLCPVEVRELTKFCQDRNIVPWVWQDKGWEQRHFGIGSVVCLPLEAGGYAQKWGWTGDPRDTRDAYKIFSQGRDLSFSHHYNLALSVHLQDTQEYLRSKNDRLQQLGIARAEIESLYWCAKWHDWGLAHEIWQSYANSQGELIVRSKSYGDPSELKGYRHELASAIAAGTQGAPFLVQYLIAAHHGKVRESLLPSDRQQKSNPKILRGVELETELPAVEISNGEILPATKLSFLEPAGNWEKQVRKLLQEYGPFKLVYLEALVREADVRVSASRMEEAIA